MTIALLTSNEDPAEWKQEVEKQLGEEIQVWPEIENREAVEYVLASAPPKGAIANLPNVKAVQSLWAGIEHITSDPDFPKHLPIIRMVDIGLTEGMQDYVLGHVMLHHLNTIRYINAQKKKHWDPIDPPLARQRKVAMLGLGKLGEACAQTLRQAGFQVLGWSRSQKEIDGIQCYSGDVGLKTVLSEASILVNLLPNTPATIKLLDAEKLSWMPKGASIVNPGRGTIFDDDALVNALKSDALSAVTLDVFWEEPLPKDHPFWGMDNVLITPHIASVTRVDTGAETAIANLKHLRAGKDIEDLEGVVNPELGY
ncbi:2-hydroxyacid dehydrogenase [Curvivirga aplysinae]|uniref:2-hydroxyacid dehydrogenase n=1 Tax=Curvivirga aplysinae TaxID=2529852 RepID=UPI0012BBD3B6|nr:glyoxylate/hydroxypyruvate reductase A [Curvivirga aplysinae]MTI08793.1 glyoxylate/hydroxypyruvate reductase A [Curvivirga aplysinae]